MAPCELNAIITEEVNRRWGEDPTIHIRSELNPDDGEVPPQPGAHLWPTQIHDDPARPSH